MTINEDDTRKLAELPNHYERVRYAVEQIGKHPLDIKPADLRVWFTDRNHELGGASQRPAVSRHYNKLLEEKGLKDPTGKQPRLTREVIEQHDADRAAAAIRDMEPEDFGPRDDAPVSPAVTAPRHVTPPSAAVTSLPPVTSEPRHESPAPAAQEPVMPRQPAAVTRESDATATVTTEAPAPAPASMPAESADYRAALADAAAMSAREANRLRFGKAKTGPSGLPEVKPSWSFRALYGGLLVGAGYGLYTVFHDVAGAPVLVAAVSAGAIELVAISIKRLADKGERYGESRGLVRFLHVLSAVIAFVIAGVNGWGHLQVPMEGNGEYFAAAGFAMCSALGYGLWTASTFIAHRATQRLRGRLEGPGVRIPKYIEDRYGPAVADRAERLSQFDEALTIDQAVTRAIAEIDAAERDQRERERLQALRDGLEAEAMERHGDQLAARLEVAQYSADVLADLMTADPAGHEAKRDDLRAWIASHKTDK